MTKPLPVPIALTIAGSDNAGCSGIQADLKTFGALGVHGMSVITSVTAQSSREFLSAWNVPTEQIDNQIEALKNLIPGSPVKTGMLPTTAIIKAVAGRLRDLGVSKLVIDPVMTSTSGGQLLKPDSLSVLRDDLFPLALLVTPNVGEAELLVGRKILNREQLREAAESILAMGPRGVLIKGGHFEEAQSCTDYLFDGQAWTTLEGPRIQTENTRGSGCTLSAAITGLLARGLPFEDSVRQAKRFVTEAISHSFSLGSGPGPLGHFWKLWK